MAPRVRGLTREPRTFTMCSSSTVTVKLHVSAQSRGQTLGEVCIMRFSSCTQVLTSCSCSALGSPRDALRHSVSSHMETATQCVSELYLENWLYRRANFFEKDRTICSEY